MASVVHQSLAVIFGAEIWRETPFVVMEYLNRGTLADRLRSGPLEVREALKIAIALAEVVEHIHAAGILHRDIKPSNVGFAGDGTLRLLDFGLSRMLEDVRRDRQDLDERPNFAGSDNSIDRDGVRTSLGVAGTPMYMSPEATQGYAPDVQFDVWSVTVLLYEALAGKNPFSAETLSATFDSIRKARVPDIRSSRPELPTALSAFFSRGLNPDIQKRPANASELRTELARVLAVVEGTTGNAL